MLLGGKNKAKLRNRTVCIRCMFCLKSRKRRNNIYLYVCVETLKKRSRKIRIVSLTEGVGGNRTSHRWGKKMEERLLTLTVLNFLVFAPFLSIIHFFFLITREWSVIKCGRNFSEARMGKGILCLPMIKLWAFVEQTGISWWKTDCMPWIVMWMRSMYLWIKKPLWKLVALQQRPFYSVTILFSWLGSDRHFLFFFFFCSALCNGL